MDLPGTEKGDPVARYERADSTRDSMNKIAREATYIHSPAVLPGKSKSSPKCKTNSAKEATNLNASGKKGAAGLGSCLSGWKKRFILLRIL
jgi:hypothetical protein